MIISIEKNIAALFAALVLTAGAVSGVCAGEPEAQDQLDALSLNQLFNLNVVTASKHEEPIDESPNVMYIVTKEEIRRRGYKSLKDIFQTIPGFGVDQRDLQPVGQVRGIAPNDNEKFALLINGHIINQVTEPEYFQSGGFPLDNLERIEVIVGPGGVFYGGETLCAILNLITKKINYNQVAGSFGSGNNTFGDGSLPDRDLQGMFGRKISDSAGIFMSGSYYERGGWGDAWRENSANSSNAALAKLDNVTGRVYPSYTMFIGGDIGNWSGQFFSQNSEQPDLHLVSTGDIDGRRDDYIYSGVIRNRHEWRKGFSSSFEVSGDLKRTVRAIVKTGSFATGAETNWDLQQTSFAGEAAIQHTVPGRNLFQLGYQGTLKQHRHNYDFIWNPDRPYTLTRDSILPDGDTVALPLNLMHAIVTPSQTHAFGMYASDKFTLERRLKFVLAFRLDRDDILDPVQSTFADLSRVYFSPRFAILAMPLEKLHLKLMYNRATRLAQTPQGSPLNHLWGIDQKGLAPSWATQNPNISRPEILNTYEVQAIYYFMKSRLTVNYWHQELKDYTSWFSPRTNVGDFKGDGFEYEVIAPVNRKISVWTNGALSNNDFTLRADANKTGSGGEAGSAFQLPSNPQGEVMGVPKFSANLGADLRVGPNFYVNPSVRFMTRQVMAQPVIEGPDTIMNFGYANNKAYVNLSISYEKITLPAINHEMDIRVIIKNLTNNTDLIGTQWMADAWRPQGLTWELGLFMRF